MAALRPVACRAHAVPGVKALVAAQGAGAAREAEERGRAGELVAPFFCLSVVLGRVSFALAFLLLGVVSGGRVGGAVEGAVLPVRSGAGDMGEEGADVGLAGAGGGGGGRGGLEVGDVGRVDPDVVVAEQFAEVVDGGWVCAMTPGVLGDVEETHVGVLWGYVLSGLRGVVGCRWGISPRLGVRNVY